MTYLPTMGSIDPANFNSTKFPGICKATNFPTLDLFKELQRQLNRVISLGGNLTLAKTPMISIDGDIGPGTVAAMNAVFPDGSWSCTSIAAGADTWVVQVQSLADQGGAPASVSSPSPPSTPSIVTPAGAVKPQSPIASGGDFLKNMGTTQMMLAGGVVVGAAFFLLKPRGRR